MGKIVLFSAVVALLSACDQGASTSQSTQVAQASVEPKPVNFRPPVMPQYIGGKISDIDFEVDSFRIKLEASRCWDKAKNLTDSIRDKSYRSCVQAKLPAGYRIVDQAIIDDFEKYTSKGPLVSLCNTMPAYACPGNR